MDFMDTANWAAKNKAQFHLMKVGDNFLMCGKADRIESEYPFKDQEEFLPAFWTVAYALECGTKFHAKNGYIPNVQALKEQQ